MKTLALNLDDEISHEAEKIACILRVNKRRLLKTPLAKESALISQDSMDILYEFEKLIAYFKNIIPLLLIALFLFSCDLKPIDYSKKTRKSSYARSSTTQTGQRRKAHARMGVSSSKRAFKNRINSRSYYNRNKHRRKLRKGD